MFEGIWSGLSNSVAGFTQLGSQHYGWSSGLTQAQIKAQAEADIRKKEQQRKIVAYTLIGMAIVGLTLIIIFKNKQK